MARRDIVSYSRPAAWGPPAIRNAPELRFVAWHPDGERVTFTGVDGDLYWIAADGSGEAERLTTGDADAQSLAPHSGAHLVVG